MVTQISATSSSPNSNSAKSHVKKIKRKNGKFELEVVRCRYSRDRILLSGQPLAYLIGK